MLAGTGSTRSQSLAQTIPFLERLTEPDRTSRIATEADPT